MGDTPVPKLKRLPGKLGGGGYVGRLVDMHASMAMWLADESKRELGGLEIITDRLIFAASAIAPIAQLRDKWIGLGSEMTEVIGAAKNKYEWAMRTSMRTSTPEPPPKRHAIMTPSSEGTCSFRAIKSWSAAKQQAATPTKDFISLCENEVVVAVGDADLEGAWLEVRNASGEQGLVPTKTSAGTARLEAVQHVPPTDVELVSSDDEGDEEAEVRVTRYWKYALQL
jgi:hypothetical protein